MNGNNFIKVPNPTSPLCTLECITTSTSGACTVPDFSHQLCLHQPKISHGAPPTWPHSPDSSHSSSLPTVDTKDSSSLSPQGPSSLPRQASTEDFTSRSPEGTHKAERMGDTQKKSRQDNGLLKEHDLHFLVAATTVVWCIA